MKLRLLFTALLIALVTCPPIRADDGQTTPLEKEMKTMGRAFKQLKKQAADASQNASSLELVAQMQKAADAAAKLVPAKAADLPEKDKAALTASYQAKMKDFSAALAKLEAAFKAGDNAGATKILGELGNLERADHKEFRKPQD